MTSSPVPIVVLASTDRTDRDALVLTALLDAPGVVAVVHDLERADDGDDSGSGTGLVLRRRVLGEGGLEGALGFGSGGGPTGSRDQVVPMEHACPGCALREDAVPVVAELLEGAAESGTPLSGILLALPLGAEIFPATRTLRAALGADGPLHRARLGLTVAVADGGRVLRQLHDGDDALLSQLSEADVVVVAPAATAPGTAADLEARRGSDVVDALRGVDSHRCDDTCEPWLTHALAGEHDDVALETAIDPVTLGAGRGFAVAGTAPDGARVAESGAWSIQLRSDRPFHPDRLMARITDLAGERTVSRGRFWLPNRPDAVCGWEATGGTVCVGVAGPWEDTAPETLLVVVGTGDGRERLRRAFDEVLVTDEEIAAGAASWLGRHDPLATYLGDPADLYRS